MVEHLVTMCKAWSSSLVPGPTNQASINSFMDARSLVGGCEIFLSVGRSETDQRDSPLPGTVKPGLDPIAVQYHCSIDCIPNRPL